MSSPTPTTPAFTTHVFTSNMESLDGIDHLPLYCQRGGLTTKSQPILRARKIFNNGTKMPPGQECTNCLKLGQDCIRYKGKFSKCCWCTAEDIHPVGLCHLPGVPSPTTLSMTSTVKKRKLDAIGEAEKHPSLRSPAFGKMQFRVNSPFKVAKRSQDLQRQKTGDTIDTEADSRDCTPSNSQISPERFAALENQVFSLNRKLDELISSVRPVSNARADSVAGESKSSEILVGSPVAGSDDMVIDNPQATVSEISQEEHTFAHPMGFPPSNCACVRK
ncbi:hypothetical protein ACLMJK_005957 [Lecanora helva]